MTTIRTTRTGTTAAARRSFSPRFKPLQTAGLLMLCAAYLQGAIVKLLYFDAAIAEMEHFGLYPAATSAAALVVFELGASSMVISGYFRWIGALALAVFTLLANYIALQFWDMPIGKEQTMTMNAFFEHIGLAGAFLLVAGHDLKVRSKRDWSAI